jgi:hypothetical protein
MTDDGYEVGYKKPPLSGRFQPGENGPRKGRRKGSKNMTSLLREMLDSKVSLLVNGRKRNVPMREALVMRLKKEILNGPARWIDRGLEISLQIDGRCSSDEMAHQWNEVLREDLTDEELEMLSRIVQKVAAKNAPEL